MSNVSEASSGKLMVQVSVQIPVFHRFLKRVIPSEAEGPAFTV